MNIIIKNTNSLTPGLMDPEVQCYIHKGCPIIPILRRTTQFLVFTPISLRSILILPPSLSKPRPS